MAISEETQVERLARVFASRYDIDWAHITPEHRDACRKQVAELLTYIDTTAFQAFFREPIGVSS